MAKTEESTFVGERKESATTFLRLAHSGQVRRAFESYAAPNFTHHNPEFRGDAESLAKAIEDSHAENPDSMLHVEHVVEEGDLVAVHSRVRQKPEDRDIAVVHLFRFEGDRISEMWDVIQPAPEKLVNENGMF